MAKSEDIEMGDLRQRAGTDVGRSLDTQNQLIEAEATGLNNITGNHLLGNLEGRSDNIDGDGPSSMFPGLNDGSPPPEIPQKFISEEMARLKQAIQEDDRGALRGLVQDRDVMNPGDALMIIFACIVLNEQQLFEQVVSKNAQFKIYPQWYALFSQPNIYDTVKNYESQAERCKLNELVLEIALEKDLTFIVELLLDLSVITPKLISLLFKDN